MIILDLDDTIFQTKSMNPKIFDSAISLIQKYYELSHSAKKVEEIISALWSNPIDEVFSKNKTPKKIVFEFYEQIKTINYSDLNISTFKDYEVIKSLSNKKIFVTTGLKELQIAKVKALGIESDFESIFIDDPRQKPRQHKIDIFSQILRATKKAPEKFWIATMCTCQLSVRPSTRI